MFINDFDGLQKHDHSRNWFSRGRELVEESNYEDALVCFEEFVAPALDGLQGIAEKFSRYHLVGTVENEFPKDPKKRQYLFCRVSEGPKGFLIRILRPQGSHMMKSVCAANALALGQLGVNLIKPGTKLKFRWVE